MSSSPTLEHAPVELSEDLIRTFTQARNVVVLTGLELSEESGIPAFQDGAMGLSVRYYADELTEREAPRSNRNRLWGWYEWRRTMMLRARPNTAHHAISGMQKFYHHVSVITQSVDDLQTRANSQEVLHLNGRLAYARCHRCGNAYEHPADAPRAKTPNCEITPPSCTLCEGPIRPNVVWFGEEPPAEDWLQALGRVEQCDLLLSVGMTAAKHPATELIHIAKERKTPVIQIAPASTTIDHLANFKVRGNMSDTLETLLKTLQSG